MSIEISTERQLVHLRRHDHVALIELDAPPANTYTYAMMLQLDAAILELRMDDEVQAIVIRGAGDKFFSAGADINMLTSIDPTSKYYFCLHANETLLRLENTPKLVIAALNGHTVGGGLEIAMACDLRIACRDAGRIGLPEVNLGVLPGTGGTQRLPRLVGKGRAMELMVTGRTFSFEEALDMGLVTAIFDRDGFIDEVLAYAQQFCPPNKASRAVGHIKRAIQTGSEIPIAEALGIERELQQRLFESTDAAAGLHAYVEKSVARFTGR
jgi:enoyl-CoA hydratase